MWRCNVVSVLLPSVKEKWKENRKCWNRMGNLLLDVQIILHATQDSCEKCSENFEGAWTIWSRYEVRWYSTGAQWKFLQIWFCDEGIFFGMLTSEFCILICDISGTLMSDKFGKFTLNCFASLMSRSVLFQWKEAVRY